MAAETIESKPPERRTIAEGFEDAIRAQLIAKPQIGNNQCELSCSSAATGTPCLCSELKRQPRRDALTLNLDKRACFFPDISPAIPITWTGVLHRNLVCAIFDNETAAVSLFVTQLNELSSGFHANLAVWRAITVLDSPLAFGKFLQHRQPIGLSSNGKCEAKRYHAKRSGDTNW
ncbi:hypothetical protein [Erythrobacter longus]|uniref:hypothetical protein n=1 Tax=Erythrobacter longus TaxID=1044 RepID=UPI00146FBD7C|nr:hypothetical protein [Erythrobacter longus]